ncbi:hypothetical protein DL766_010594 [Monosporascus sp. MC13-8B]|nr:hypothetical protein DL766_010594 [Monosporascus sp. MC13-8B]
MNHPLESSDASRLWTATIEQRIEQRIAQRRARRRGPFSASSSLIKHGISSSIKQPIASELPAKPQNFPRHTRTSFKMRFATFVATFLAGTAMAIPTAEKARTDHGNTPSSYDPCSGLYDSAQCCATDVLGVADLDCASPPKVPHSASDFRKTCANIGQRARCCVLPVLGQGVLCQTPVGV